MAYLLGGGVMGIDGGMIAIREQANKLAAMVQAYSNNRDKQVQIEVKNYGCKELGWICRIEVKS